MKRRRLRKVRIISILKQHQAGLGGREMCLKHKIRYATFWKRRSKNSGPDVSDARRLTTLEGENAKYQKMLPRRLL